MTVHQPARPPARDEPSQRRVREVLRGLFGLLALLLLLVGVPLALSRIGSPLPRRIPALDKIREGLLQGPMPWSVIVRGMAAVVWVAWGAFALAVVAEAYGWIRGVDVTRLSAGRPFQSLACNLVAAAVLMLPSLPRLASAPVAAPVPVLIQTQAAAASGVSTPAMAADSVVRVASAVAPASTTTYVVQRHDCLWWIAERYLGDPFRYREIVELTEATVQPDGRRLEDPHWIYPGWILTLPPDAVGLPDRPDDSARPADTGWAHSVQPPATTPVVSPPSTTPAGPQPALSHSAAPPSTGGSTVPRAPTSATSTTRTSVTRIAKSGQSSPARAANREWIAAGIGAGGLLAGVVMLRLDRLRRAQHRRRRRGRDVVRPDPTLEPIERGARAIAATEAATWVDMTLRYAWSALAAAGGGGVESVLCVRPGAFGVEVVVDPPAPPVGRFILGPDGRTWRLDPDLDLDELSARADGQTALVPALITVGSTADGPLLIDLERAGVLAVEGDTAGVTAFLAARALELATAPWACDTPIYLLGGDLRLAALDLVQVVDDPDAFVEKLGGLMTLSGDDLNMPTTLAARTRPDNLEAWEPSVVVVAPGSTSDATLAALASRAEPKRSGVAMIAAGPVPGATWRLVIGADGRGALEPLGIGVDARVDPEMVEGMIGLLVPTAGDSDIAPVIDVAASQEPRPVQSAVFDGEVRVLGPVEVTWAADLGEGPPQRANLLAALVAYLGTHDERPVPAQRLQNALWPLRDDHPRAGEVKDGTLRTTVSRARRALGLDSTGAAHLSDARCGAYSLGPRFSCDWRRFHRFASAARAASSEEAIELLRQALVLVRGRPFEDAPPIFGWAEAEQLISYMEVAIAEAAEDLAERARAAGDPAIATWAANQGLRALPAREALYRVKMQAAFDAGDPDGIEQAYIEARRAALAIDPLEELQIETENLYTRLKRGTRLVDAHV